MKARWREVLRTYYGNANREVSRASLLAGLKPGGVLVLGSAVLLDEQERKAIQAFAQSGGSVLATWGMVRAMRRAVVAGLATSVHRGRTAAR